MAVQTDKSNDCEKIELLLAALDGVEFGLFVLDDAGQVVFWNHAAENQTGHLSAEMVGSPLGEDILLSYGERGELKGAQPANGKGIRYFKHRKGHRVAVRWRSSQLRNAAGEAIGRVEWFRALEDPDSVAAQSISDGSGHSRSREALEEHLRRSFAQWSQGSVPLSVLSVQVDQAAQMRRTHGKDACEAMMDVVEKTLAGSLRPTEVMGRWGENEYLVITHHRLLPALERHALRLASIAQAAEFRWWGDKISLTVTIGGTVAAGEESIKDLLARAGECVKLASEQAADRRVRVQAAENAGEEETCSPSLAS
jgi:diguanylate cyclase (GGDEF)-like protein/PAS domain S-box-containing protein